MTLEKENGDEVVYRIVGPDEHDSTRGYISMDSPLAKALLKKEVDDEISIKNEFQQNIYYIVDIRY